MRNFLQETRGVLSNLGMTPEDVTYIGSLDAPAYACTWAEFETLADFEYDDGYGAAEIPNDLKIWFNNGGHLRRYEYDGAEWWEYIEPFVRPAAPLPIKALHGKWWSRLGDLSREETAS